MSEAHSTFPSRLHDPHETHPVVPKEICERTCHFRCAENHAITKQNVANRLAGIIQCFPSIELYDSASYRPDLSSSMSLGAELPFRKHALFPERVQSTVCMFVGRKSTRIHAPPPITPESAG